MTLRNKLLNQKKMKMKNILLFILILLNSYLIAQADRSIVDTETKFANTITVEDLTRHLTILSADDMEGRETGQEGQYKAARYIEQVIKDFGLEGVGADNSYSQAISYISERWSKVEMELEDEKLRHLWDFYAFPSKNKSKATVNYNELTFLGYGIDDDRYSDYSNANVKGKSILILAGEPVNKKEVSYLTGTKAMSEWAKNLDLKLEAAFKHGVETVFVLDVDFQKNLSNARKIALDSRMHMGFSEKPGEHFSNSVYVSSSTAKKMMGSQYKNIIKTRKRITKKGRSKPLTFPVNISLTQEKTVRELIGENMLAFVEGNDPALKDEILVLTAHYDHIGKRGDAIFNGADDNGSGTSTILEVCEAFTLAKEEGHGPRRSVLFMLVSGEEKGLLGSQYYVEHPLFPLENTIANINVDMVGRVDEKHADNPEYIYVIGADRLSTELHNINEAANDRHTQLELDYTYNAEDDPNRYYYRSDHYNFAKKGIPAVFYFNGTHDDYHQDTDTIEKINFEKMAVIGKLVFHTAWELANRDKRIEVDVEP